MKLSKYFTSEELCKSDTASRNGIDNLTQDPRILSNLRELAINVLDKVREHYGVPIRPNSGFRCYDLECAIYYKKVAQLKRQGGKAAVLEWFNKKSHPKGEAVDIEVPGISNRDLYMWIKDNLEFDQLILEGVDDPKDPRSGWVHVSFRKGNNRMQAFEMPETGL